MIFDLIRKVIICSSIKKNSFSDGHSLLSRRLIGSRIYSQIWQQEVMRGYIRLLFLPAD